MRRFRMECKRSKDDRAFEISYERAEGLHLLVRIADDDTDATVSAQLRKLADQISVPIAGLPQ